MANRKGQFKKGGGRVGTAAIVVAAAPRSPAKRRASAPVRKAAKPRRKAHHRSKGFSGTEKLAALAIAGLGLAAIVGDNSKMSPTGSGLRSLIEKIPGNKTVGPVAAVGLAAWGVNRFLFRNKWLALAGKVGVVAAAINIGQKLGSGTEIKWLGDEDEDDRGGYVADVR